MNQIVILEAARTRPEELRRHAPPRRGPGWLRRTVARLAVRLAAAADPAALPTARPPSDHARGGMVTAGR